MDTQDTYEMIEKKAKRRKTITNAVIYVFMSSPVLRAAVFSVPGIALEALMTVAGVYMIFAPKNY